MPKPDCLFDVNRTFLRKKLIISPSLEYYLPILKFDIVISILASYLTEI